MRRKKHNKTSTKTLQHRKGVLFIFLSVLGLSALGLLTVTKVVQYTKYDTSKTMQNTLKRARTLRRSTTETPNDGTRITADGEKGEGGLGSGTAAITSTSVTSGEILQDEKEQEKEQEKEMMVILSERNIEKEADRKHGNLLLFIANLTAENELLKTELTAAMSASMPTPTPPIIRAVIPAVVPAIITTTDAASDYFKLTSAYLVFLDTKGTTSKHGVSPDVIVQEWNKQDVWGPHRLNYWHGYLHKRGKDTLTTD